jgi:hypothetical protein
LNGIRGKACLLKYFADLQSDHRRQIRWFDDDGVPGHQRHNGFAQGNGERVIPRWNDADDTERVIDDL